MINTDYSPVQTSWTFWGTFSVIRKLILICGEHLCSAIFKKGSAMFVSSRKLEKKVIEWIQFFFKN